MVPHRRGRFKYASPTEFQQSLALRVSMAGFLGRFPGVLRGGVVLLYVFPKPHLRAHRANRFILIHRTTLVALRPDCDRLDPNPVALEAMNRNIKIDYPLDPGMSWTETRDLQKEMAVRTLARDRTGGTKNNIKKSLRNNWAEIDRCRSTGWGTSGQAPCAI